MPRTSRDRQLLLRLIARFQTEEADLRREASILMSQLTATEHLRQELEAELKKGAKQPAKE